ncbi:hypothetical protein OG440_39400 (plasmid) [Streptomyces sp. NBC_00637]|uniref:hypothetical protein n=1 Tax=Streptomyces sp. NBC_00637 TaxID=2903667 RepID=UPI002F91536D
MTAYVVPLLLTAAAAALTYVFCVRPMLKGRGCHMTPQQSSCHTASDTTDTRQDARSTAPDATDAEIKRLREEVQLLHHELDLRSTEGTVRLQKDESR